MAKLPALISVLAKFEPRGVNAVENLTRELRRAGLITQGKRGVGAPDMTCPDITNMLLGTVSRQAKEAPEAVKKLREAGIMGEFTSAGKDAVDDLLYQLPVPPDTWPTDRVLTAGEFLDALMECMSSKHGMLLLKNGEDVSSLSIELLDPATGDGAVKFNFWAGMANEVSITFKCLDRDAPYGIQHAAVIPHLALFYFANVKGKA